jgi:hypothetical protein
VVCGNMHLLPLVTNAAMFCSPQGGMEKKDLYISVAMALLLLYYGMIRLTGAS